MEDYDAVCSLVDSYIVDGGWIDVNAEIAKKSLKQFIKMNGILLGVCNGEIFGGVAGYMMPGLFTSDIFFSVMFFYVKKKYRKYTVTFMESLDSMFRANGITRVVYGAPLNIQKGVPLNGKFDDYKKLCRFFRMRGYNLLESHYCKEL